MKIRHADHRDKIELQMTPMIDIVFLLLIFFLVASKMDESASVTLPEARHGTEVTSNDALVILVAKGTGDDAIVKTFDGREIQGDEAAQETQIGEYIEAEPIGQMLPPTAGAWWRTGNALEALGRVDDAREAYRSALREDPDFERAAEALDALE